jgi:hypothetical protein
LDIGFFNAEIAEMNEEKLRVLGVEKDSSQEARGFTAKNTNVTSTIIVVKIFGSFLEFIYLPKAVEIPLDPHQILWKFDNNFAHTQSTC